MKVISRNRFGPRWRRICAPFGQSPLSAYHRQHETRSRTIRWHHGARTLGDFDVAGSFDELTTTQQQLVRTAAGFRLRGCRGA
jgi:hypothetical protein